MNPDSRLERAEAVAATLQDTALREQLYRYAQDLQSLLEDKCVLEQRYGVLIESYNNLRKGHAALSELREAELNLQISSTIFQSVTEGVMIIDIEGIILAVNPAFLRMSGYAAEDVIGRSPNFSKSGVQDARFYQRFWMELGEKGRWEGEIFSRNKYGDIYMEWVSVTAARDGDGRIHSYVAIFSSSL